MKNHEDYMHHCLELAESVEPNEVPVAAVIVAIDSGEIIASGLNTREAEQSVLAHAEINALQQAAKRLSSWNLSGHAIYISLEPCPMCAGAILQSHISQIIFSAYDPKTGAFGSRYNLTTKNLQVTGGILEKEGLSLLQNFFKDKRD